MFFLVVNYVKLAPYAVPRPAQRRQPHGVSLVFAPLAPAGIWLGVWLHEGGKIFEERAFYGVSYTLLFLTGVKLIWDAVVH